MKDVACTIYDCEFNLYYKGTIIDNRVYLMDEDNKYIPPKEQVCEYVDFGMVQFYIGYYDEADMDSGEVNCKWGYFKLSTGDIVVPPSYDYGYPFYGDRAKVKRAEKYGFIDTKGNLVVDTIWDDSAHAFHKALCWVKSGSRFGYINKDGVIILDPQFEMAKEFKFIGETYDDEKYVALVKKNGKYGYIDQDGGYIFEPNLHDAREFWSVGYAPVMINEKWGFIDKRGEFVVALQFEDVGEDKGFIITENIDKEKAIFGSNRQAIDFYTVKKYGKWGLMDSDFNIVMPEEGNKYVLFRNKKIYIKEGRVTSIRELKK